MLPLTLRHLVPACHSVLIPRSRLALVIGQEHLHPRKRRALCAFAGGRGGYGASRGCHTER